ncbi:hypothetical protein JCM10212_006815 [Sporobolomyces blumeae]
MDPPPVPPRPSQPPAIPPRPPPPRPPAAGPPEYPPHCRGPLLADGSSPQSGVLIAGIKWQASGILEQGANLPGQNVAIDHPLTISMGPAGTCVDQKGRQRTEILSWPPSQAGESWLYQWRFHLSPALPTAYKFFHLTQLLSRETGGFVVALGLVHGKVKVSSQIVRPPGESGAGDEPLPEVDADKVWGRTTYHRMSVAFGPNGSIDYTVQDSVTYEPILRYCVENVNVPAKASVKCGLYRAHVCSAATAVVGDFNFSKVS